MLKRTATLSVAILALFLLGQPTQADFVEFDFQGESDDTEHDVGVPDATNTYWLAQTGLGTNDTDARNQPKIQVKSSVAWDSGTSTGDLVKEWLTNRAVIDYTLSLNMEELAGEAGTLGLDLDDDGTTDSNFTESLKNGAWNLTFVFGGGASNTSAFKNVKFVHKGSVQYAGYNSGTLDDDPPFIATGSTDWGAFLDSSSEDADALADKFEKIWIGIDISVDTAATHTSYIAVDNVRLTAVPEPASLTLLGVGGLMMLRRRRRG